MNQQMDTPTQNERIATLAARAAVNEYAEKHIQPLANDMAAIKTSVELQGQRLAIFLGKNGDGGILEKSLRDMQSQINEVRNDFKTCQTRHDNEELANVSEHSTVKATAKAWRSFALRACIVAAFLIQIGWDVWKTYHPK